MNKIEEVISCKFYLISTLIHNRMNKIELEELRQKLIIVNSILEQYQNDKSISQEKIEIVKNYLK